LPPATPRSSKPAKLSRTKSTEESDYRSCEAAGPGCLAFLYREECHMKLKKSIRKLYDLGSRFDIAAERIIVATIKKLKKKKLKKKKLKKR
jgi:hypothetical protein